MISRGNHILSLQRFPLLFLLPILFALLLFALHLMQQALLPVFDFTERSPRLYFNPVYFHVVFASVFICLFSFLF
jgi:hypothetical protein